MKKAIFYVIIALKGYFVNSLAHYYYLTGEFDMKLAIIGFGGMGSFHAEKGVGRYNDSKSGEPVEVAGIYDISEERMNVARERGLHVYSSPEQIWNDKEIEAVVIATPNDKHLEYVEAAAAAGKNIIVEKPAGMSHAEVMRMYRAAEEGGVVFTPHQNRRWDDDFVTVKNIVNSDILGKTYCVESRVMGANGIPGAWRKLPECGGGMMLDWGVHLIDQMLCMIGGRVKSVYCSYSYNAGEAVDDGFVFEAKFDTGVTYRIVVDTNTFVELPRWQVYAVDGTMAVTNWRNFKVEGKMIRCLIRHDDQLVGVSAGNGFTKTMAKRRSETVEELPISVMRGDKTAFYRNFVKAVRGNDSTTVKKEQIDRLFRIMEIAKQSSDQNTVIHCDI